jgi:hypothetical protein
MTGYRISSTDKYLHMQDVRYRSWKGAEQRRAWTGFTTPDGRYSDAGSY